MHTSISAALRAKSPVVGIRLDGTDVFYVRTARLQKSLAEVTVSSVQINNNWLEIRGVSKHGGSKCCRHVRVTNWKFCNFQWAQKQQERCNIKLPKGLLAAMKLAFADTEGWVEFQYISKETKAIVVSKGVPIDLSAYSEHEFLLHKDGGNFTISEKLSGMKVKSARTLPNVIKETIQVLSNLSLDARLKATVTIEAEVLRKFEMVCAK